jgi:hypothetical protein
VVGVWLIEADSNNKVLVVDGKRDRRRPGLRTRRARSTANATPNSLIMFRLMRISHTAAAAAKDVADFRLDPVQVSCLRFLSFFRRSQFSRIAGIGPRSTEGAILPAPEWKACVEKIAVPRFSGDGRGKSLEIAQPSSNILA